MRLIASYNVNGYFPFKCSPGGTQHCCIVSFSAITDHLVSYLFHKYFSKLTSFTHLLTSVVHSFINILVHGELFWLKFIVSLHCPAILGNVLKAVKMVMTTPKFLLENNQQYIVWD